jgi:hypothetical protein
MLIAAASILLASPLLPAQAVGTGSIVGVVTDPKGKALAGTKVEITNHTTGARIHVATSAVGLYSSGPIQPGNYVVRVEAKNFKTAAMTLAVQIGNTVRGDVRVEAGLESEVVEVQNTNVINVEQGTLQGVIKPEQFEGLPISGRSFPDLAQFEPGAQTQDGSLFGPSKNGLPSISVLGTFGRTTRIAVDGVDVSDEIVGAATQNIPESAIREFQVSQSLLDLSTGPTSFGAVNVTTRTGSNQIHGDAFGVYGGDQGAAALPGSTTSSFQRELFGGDAGGAIIKDKVFWFADAERVQQNLTTGEPFSYPFDGLKATLVEPYREFDTDERVDWNMRGSTRAFYRLNFFQNSDLRPNGSASSTQQFRNDNNTLTNALGIDFNTGVYAHSLRFEYLKLRSETEDATGSLSGIDNPIPGLGINIGASTAGNCILSSGGSYCGGPSWLAPQQNIQSNKEAKYDGSRVLGEHIIRYGATFDLIEGARLAAFSRYPQVGTTSVGISTSSDPTSYSAEWVSLGNGVGFSTAKPAFGFPAGGVGPDYHLEMYVGDRWKYRPKLTLTYGLGYRFDTSRSDSGLGSLPQLNQWAPGLGNQIRNPNLNLAPQLGFAWDSGGNGKTIIRGGAGLFYGNSLWSNMLYDSPARLTKGVYNDAPEVCSGGVPGSFVWPTSLAGVTSLAGGAATVVTTPAGLEAQPTFCGGTISAVAPEILALSSAFQASAATVGGSQPNRNFVSSALSGLNPSYDLLYPGYRTPRSWQMNAGIQQEIRPGTVFSLDYVRNIGEHYLIGQDVNHSGAAHSFNQANAVAARDAAQRAHGCPAGIDQVTCMIQALGQAGAQAAYSRAGLDSNLQTAGGAPCPYCAFPGWTPIPNSKNIQNNGALGGLDMLFPDGRSVFGGVEAKLVTRINKPVRGVKSADIQVSYALSKFLSQAQDQDSVNLATDNDNPLRYTGPNALDRKHQISFGGTFELPFSLKASIIGHFYSPLAQNLLLPELTNGGEIFASDWLGSGLGAGGAPEPVPGTQLGQFQHATNIDNLQSVISGYNHTYAGKLTPAGNCLVGNNAECPGLISSTPVMSSADMAALGWVMPTLGSVGPDALGIPWLKSIDLKASRSFKIGQVRIDPSVSVFNVFNLVNTFLPGNLPGASLLPGQNGLLAPNVVGGVTSSSGFAPFRASFQSGTYALGAPRRLEFGLNIKF